MLASTERSSEALRVVWVFPGELAGTLDKATWLQTARELSGLGLRVTLISVGQADPRMEQGVGMLTIPRPDKYLLRQVVYHLRVRRYIIKNWHAIDVIYFHQMSAPWLLPLRLRRRILGHRRPLLVMDSRTVPMETKANATWKDRLRARFYWFMNRLANRWTDGQTAITKRMAQVIHIPSRQLWGTWPSGVDLEGFIPAQSVRRWPAEGEPIHLTYVGALHYQRNLITLARAVEIANKEGMKFEFSMIGSGSAQEELAEFANQTEGRVRVLPPVPGEDVPGLLAEAHVGVLPFPDEEKFRVSSPIKLFEYMGTGLTVLATRIVCHTDVIGDGGYVFWAESADVDGLLTAVRNIWYDRNALPGKGREAAIAAEEWTWHHSAAKLKAALEYGVSLHE